MIRVFNDTDTTFTTNGNRVIEPTKARVICNSNGDFYLEMICSTDYSADIQANSIIVTPTPQGVQAFRVRNITKNRKKLEIKAYHVFYDSQNYCINNNVAYYVSANDALNYFNSNLDATSPFTCYSDIMTIHSIREVRKSFFEVVNDVLEVWGGHLVRDNWNISILSSVGTDNGITIEYGKNLQELTATYDWSNVVTKALPVGQEGITLDSVYVYSSVQYDIPYTKVIQIEQNINKDDYPTEADYIQAVKTDLYNKAVAYVGIYCYPNVNYTLKGQPEKVTNIGDTIQVKDRRIGVDITTEVIAYEYDAIQERYANLEFGNFAPSLGELMSTINASIANSTSNTLTVVNSEISGAVADAKADILNTMKSGQCIYDLNTMTIVDALPANTAVNALKFDDDGIMYSTGGVAGTFKNILSLDGRLTVGQNKAYFDIYKNNAVIGGIDADGLYYGNTRINSDIVVNGKNILEYSTADTITYTNYITAGAVSSGDLYFTLPLQKDMGTLTPTFSNLDITLYDTTETILNNIESDIDYTITITPESGYMNILITYTQPFNQPYAIKIDATVTLT